MEDSQESSEEHWKRVTNYPDCEGYCELCSTTQKCGYHIWFTRTFAELIQICTQRWQLPLRQSQPGSAEVAMRQRSAHQLQLRAADAVTQRKMLQLDWRARIQSTRQTDVARPFQNIQSADLYPLSQTFSVITANLVQRSLSRGSLVHALDDHHLKAPHRLKATLVEGELRALLVE